MTLLTPIWNNLEQFSQEKEGSCKSSHKLELTCPIPQAPVRMAEETAELELLEFCLIHQGKVVWIRAGAAENVETSEQELDPNNSCSSLT